MKNDILLLMLLAITYNTSSMDFLSDSELGLDEWIASLGKPLALTSGVIDHGISLEMDNIQEETTVLSSPKAPEAETSDCCVDLRVNKLQKIITPKETEKKKKIYTVKCYIEDCTKTFLARRAQKSLVLQLLGHVYSVHKPSLYDEVRLITKKDAFKEKKKFRIVCPYGCGRLLKSKTLGRLQRALLVHHGATQVHNAKEFATTKEYVLQNTVILEE